MAEVDGHAVGIIMGSTYGKGLRPWIALKCLYHNAALLFGGTYEQNVCTQKLISEITLYPKQTVNMVIRSSLEKRWVELKQDESDRRNKHIQLTESGEVFAKQVIESYWNAASDAFSELESNERKIMIQALNTFSHSFAEKVQKING